MTILWPLIPAVVLHELGHAWHYRWLKGRWPTITFKWYMIQTGVRSDVSVAEKLENIAAGIVAGLPALPIAPSWPILGIYGTMCLWDLALAGGLIYVGFTWAWHRRLDDHPDFKDGVTA